MKKSKFNLSYDNSLTLDMGKLVPFYIQDCIPGDSYRLRLQSFIRAQPMLAPLMHRVNFYTQYWFVPYRILWDNWTDFITGGLSGNSTPTFPTMKVKSETSSLADYFGIPLTKGENTLEVSALPFRAYAEIWNARYRDEDLQGEVSVSYADGLDTITQTKLLQPSWRKDYFTTARPFTQRGSQISVPVNSFGVSTSQNYKGSIRLQSNNVRFSSDYNGDFVNNLQVVVTGITLLKSAFSSVLNSDLDSFFIPVSNFSSVSLSRSSLSASYSFVCPAYGNIFQVSVKVSASAISGLSQDIRVSASGNFVVDLFNRSLTDSPVTSTDVVLSTSPKEIVYLVSGTSSSVNIRDLRLSSALQRYQERSLEYGNRYEEFIQREFGVKPRDSRIQRPEYLGGSESVLQISEVLQTSEGTDTGVGTMRGHGVTALRSRGIRFRCPEHGIIIGLLSIRPRAVYTQGLERFWRKFSKLDYYVPELANIGMQEVFETELFANGETANYDKVFGYAPRYAEYRSRPNKVCGEFRNVLDFWNLARVFDNAPALNSDFLTMNPSKRVFAEQTQNSFLCMVYNDAKAWRPIPKRAKNILQ